MQWLKQHLVDLLISFFFLLLIGIIASKNYIPGTLLTGIDNFHIEFNLPLAAFRAWNGVWQENQGVGILSGLAQASELPRIVIYWLLGRVLPVIDIRYAYVFANLYVGVLGAYFLTRYLTRSRWAGLSAGLFYLFNLNTIQVFFMPTEMFVVNYAALPWLFLLTFIFLSEGRRKNLFAYALLLLLFSTLGMTPTIFVVYTTFLSVVLLLSLLFCTTTVRRVIALLVTTIGMSLFFMLPFAYFGLHGSHVLKEAKINSIFSVENYLFNAARNNWSDLLSLKGMWFDYSNYVGGTWQPLMKVWEDWLSTKATYFNGATIIVLIGLCFGLVKKKITIVIMGVIAFTSLLVLRGEAPPFGWVLSSIRQLPIIAEAFRTPFTKFAPILSLGYSVLFGTGVYAIFAWIKDKWLRKTVAISLSCFTLIFCIYLYLPVFRGAFFESRTRLVFPQVYFELFTSMQRSDNGRTAVLPMPNNLGWIETTWGYLGSGFLWYGIEQPILDRAFDVWSPYNETFYNEFSNALYGNDQDSVKKVVQKYDVKYVLLDESVIVPGQDREILRTEETKRLASELGWKQVFQEGFLTVWDTGEQSDKVVSAPASYTMAEADTSKVRRDVAWEGVGTYVSDNQKTQSVGESDNSESRILYPFAGLMREETKGIEYRGNGITISSDHSLTQGSELWVPGWRVGDIVRINYGDGEALPAYTVNGQDGPKFLGQEKPEEGKSYIVARVSEGEEWGEYLQEQKFEIRNEKLEIEVPGEPQVYDFGVAGAGTIGNCDVLKRGRAEKSQLTGSLPVSPTDRLNILADSQDFVSGRDTGEQGTSYVADERGAVCDYIVMSELDTRLSYLMRMQGENREGRSLKYFLYNTGSKRNDIEYLLGKDKFDQTFGLLPWTWDGHYTLNIETRSFGQRAENKIDPVEVRYFPLKQIAGARIVNDGFANQDIRFKNNLEVTHVKKTGTWLYGMGVKPADTKVMAGEGGLIKLSQGYNEGWVGLRVNSNSEYRISKLEHVKVDGWANGWIVDNSQISNGDTAMVVIFYWPQLLQYIGFGLLAMTIIVLVFRRK